MRVLRARHTIVSALGEAVYRGSRLPLGRDLPCKRPWAKQVAPHLQQLPGVPQLHRPGAWARTTFSSCVATPQLSTRPSRGMAKKSETQKLRVNQQISGVEVVRVIDLEGNDLGTFIDNARVAFCR
eukprot:SAG11_NODE_2841_length_2917_cov_2.825701_6_plen_126_part_00